MTAASKEPLKPHKVIGARLPAEWTLDSLFFLPKTVHDRGGHSGSHRCHLRRLGIQVLSIKVYSELLGETISLQVQQLRSAKHRKAI